MGKATDEWSVGDLDAGFKNAALVLDETFVTPNTSHQCLETRTAMAYWQNGKVYVHSGAQSTAQTVPAIARWLGIDPEQRRGHQRIHRRRLRQQDHRSHFADHSGAAVEEDQRAGDDAHQPRGRTLHRPRAARLPRPHEGRLHEGRPDHRGRYVRDLRQRSVRSGGRCRLVRPHCFAAVPAAGDALARGNGADQYAAAQCAELAGRHAGHRAHGAAAGEGRAQARRRSGRDPAHQRAGGQGAVRTAGRREAAVCHQRVRQGSARPRGGAVQVG